MTQRASFHPRIDRGSSAPVGAQLRGQIEYAIACGTLEPGSRLPTVRGLADRLGLSPVTVSQVYRDLQERRLLVASPGRGTFVAHDLAASADPGRGRRLRALMDAVVEEGRRWGLQGDELVRRFAAHAARDGGSRTRATILLVGLFPDATESYARDLQALLGGTAEVRATTFQRLRDGDLTAARAADLAVTFPYMLTDLRDLLDGSTPVTFLRFLPSDRTRIALAGIDPRSHLVGVATLPGFLPALEEGIARFASHVPDVEHCLLQDGDLIDRLARASVVVYASGAGRVRDLVAGGIPTIEFRHTPDPAFVTTELARSLTSLVGTPATATDPARAGAVG